MDRDRKNLEERAEELERLEQELIQRSRTLDEFAEHIERWQKHVDAKETRLQHLSAKVEASKILVATTEKRALSMEATVEEERRRFLREIAAKQKDMAQMELERASALEEAERRLADSKRTAAAVRSEQEHLARVRSQVAQYNQSLASRKDEEEASKRMVDELHEEAERAKALLQNLAERVEKLKSELEVLEARKVDRTELIRREDLYKHLESEYQILEKAFGKNAEASGGLATWLTTRGKVLAENIAQVTRRETEVLRRELEVDSGEARQIRLAESERIVASKEARLQRELSEIALLKSELEEKLTEVDSERISIEKLNRDSASLKRNLEVRELAQQKKEEAIGVEQEHLRLEREKLSTKLAELHRSEDELDSRAKSLSELERQLEIRQLEIERYGEDARARKLNEAREEITRKLRRLRVAAITIGSPRDLVASTSALEEEVSATSRPSTTEIEKWEALLLDLIQDVHRQRHGFSSSNASVVPNATHPQPSSSSFEFNQLRKGLNSGQEVGEIISKLAGLGKKAQSETVLPRSEEAFQQEITSAPSVL